MGDDTNISVIIIYSLVFIFIVFLFLQQGNIINTQGTTGYALFDTDVFTKLSDLSLTTLIIIAVVLVLIIFGGFFLYKKLKKKKELANIQPNEKAISDLNKEFNVPSPTKTEKQESNLLDTDLNKLFMEETPVPSPTQTQKINVETEKPEIKLEEERIEEKEFNLDELKQLIKSLMKKNYTKESVVKYLNNKGYNLIQIRRAINSINEDSLGNYIENSLSQGFSKQEIINSLLKSGWNKEDILKHF